MKFFELKDKKPILIFELGLFNLFALIGLLPTFYAQYLLFGLGGCCGTGSLAPFYQDNLSRLALIAGSFILCSCFEGFLLLVWLKPQNRSRDKLMAYIRWMLLRSLSALFLLFAAIALPGIHFVYWLVGIGFLFGSDSVMYRFAPAFIWPDQPQAIQRNHFNKIVLYLTCLYLFVLTKPVLFIQAGACGCERISSLKANMHTFQAIVETYAVDNQGKYPQNLTVLKQHAIQKGREYWKEFSNPFSHQSGLWLSYAQLPVDNPRFGHEKVPYNLSGGPYLDILGIPIYQLNFVRKAASSGLVIYEPVSPTRYYIYGLRKDGTFIFDKGAPFTLSNS